MINKLKPNYLEGAIHYQESNILDISVTKKKHNKIHCISNIIEVHIRFK